MGTWRFGVSVRRKGAPRGDKGRTTKQLASLGEAPIWDLLSPQTRRGVILSWAMQTGGPWPVVMIVRAIACHGTECRSHDSVPDVEPSTERRLTPESQHLQTMHALTQALSLAYFMLTTTTTTNRTSALGNKEPFTMHFTIPK